MKNILCSTTWKICCLTNIRKETQHSEQKIERSQRQFSVNCPTPQRITNCSFIWKTLASIQKTCGKKSLCPSPRHGTNQIIRLVEIDREKLSTTHRHIKKAKSRGKYKHIANILHFFILSKHKRHVDGDGNKVDGKVEYEYKIYINKVCNYTYKMPFWIEISIGRFFPFIFSKYSICAVHFIFGWPFTHLFLKGVYSIPIRITILDSE